MEYRDGRVVEFDALCEEVLSRPGAAERIAADVAAMNTELEEEKQLTEDRLDELRGVLARQRAHLEEHGVLYDAPGPDVEDLEWVIGEIERLRRERDEARKIVLDLWRQASRTVCMVYEDLGSKYAWVPDTREDLW